MVVVKANGYGHGAKEIAKASIEAGADRLGVATVDEAKELRDAGIRAPIHLLTGFLPSQERLVHNLNLIPSVYTEEQARALSKIRRPIKVHIKVDTGMGRIGIKPEQALIFIRKIKKINEIEIEGLFTHFATADKENSFLAKKQLKIFKGLIRDLANEGLIFKVNHSANSAAAILNPSSHLQMVRIGIAAYGLHPSESTRDKIKLKPALSWHARLAFVKKVKAGQTVSYGATHRLVADGFIATVPVGYADGYSRLLSNNTQTIINNRKARQIGRICMDQFMIDVTGIKADVGDKVTLIGRQNDIEISADSIAKALNTINYEVVCSIASRVPRYYEPL